MSEETETKAETTPSISARIIMMLIKAAAAVITLVITYFIYQQMMNTAPRASRTPPERLARLVDVSAAQAFTKPVTIEARGVVMAAKEISLRPQVSGEVVSIDERLIPGWRFNQDDVLLTIEQEDYKYALEQAKSALTQAQASLTLEIGNQEVAQGEYKVLGEDLSDADKSLVFREPQLATAKAQVSSNKARVADAELDLKRTSLRAPFDALVMQKNVDTGSILSPQSDIIKLIGTDTYWIELSIPHTDLKWIRTSTDSELGSTVVLRHPKVWGQEATREGYVLHLLPELSNQGRMARILVAVDDPLAIKAENAGLPPLLIGQFLEADVIGIPVANSIEIPREFLRNGDMIWVMAENNTLEIRSLDIVYRGMSTVLATGGIREGEQIVVNDLSTASEGMALRTNSSSTEPAKPVDAVSGEES